MRKIIIDGLGCQRRTALLEDGELQELIIEDDEKRLSIGDIYVGTVKKILPSKFAFVDIGLDKNAFLYLNDKKNEHLFKFNASKNKDELNIKQGQEIFVQIEKESLGEKGAMLTTNLSFAGKYVVLLYNSNNGVTVSKKIDDISEKNRLKEIAENLIPEKFGLIMRTNCSAAEESEIENEIRELLEEVEEVLKKGKYTKAPSLIYEVENESEKLIRDFIINDEDEVIVNDMELYNKIKKPCIKFYENDVPIFDYYFIETKIDELLRNKVWLKSGGFIIIEETEALTVIDVNTGKHTSSSHRKTVLKTNSEAAAEILKQIRLRNISGIIIIDFIDMKLEEDKKAIEMLLIENKKKDRQPVTIVGMTELGLMQLTRRKTTEPLSKQLLCTCPQCSGIGVVGNERYITDKIKNKIISIFSQTIYNKVILSSNKRVIDAFREMDYKRIEQQYNKTIGFEVIQTQKLDYFKIEQILKE